MRKVGGIIMMTIGGISMLGFFVLMLTGMLSVEPLTPVDWTVLGIGVSVVVLGNWLIITSKRSVKEQVERYEG